MHFPMSFLAISRKSQKKTYRHLDMHIIIIITIISLFLNLMKIK